jgi:resuscitation-promoting factor RpfB
LAKHHHHISPAIFLLGLVTFLLACQTLPSTSESPPTTTKEVKPVILVVDGTTLSLQTTAGSVKDFLKENNIIIHSSDIVKPELDSPIPDAMLNGIPITVTITRVTESLEVIPESLSYSRQIIRSAEMSVGDPPLLLVAGQAGLQEVTLRIIYHNGLEVERWVTSTRIVEPARDEIVMIGMGSNRDEIPLNGTLAYIKDGRPNVWRDRTNQSIGLAIDAQLDRRVFQLSPDGRFLLFSTGENGPESANQGFRNKLWVVEVRGLAEPEALRIENVLWAGWDPAAIDQPRFAYTTARTTTVPPGWEANNDLWLFELAELDASQPAPVRLIENYATPYGWWGGQYAWSPTGKYIAYGFPSEIGLLEIYEPGLAGESLTDPQMPASERTILHTFQEFETGGEWAWTPSLSWSADSRFLAFSEHLLVESDIKSQFNLTLLDLAERMTTPISENAGPWSVALFSPQTIEHGEVVAYLRAHETANILTGPYILYVDDQTGDNPRTVFPLGDERGQFSRTNQSLAWGPDESTIAFIYDDALHLMNLLTGDLYRGPADDTVSSTISWAPYGAAADE